MRTHLQKRIADIKAAKLTKRREQRYIGQLKRQGWCNMDVWGLNTHLANYMLPMVRQLFAKPSGYPCILNSVKEWQAIGAEIVWALERYAKDDFSELAEQATGYRVMDKIDNKKLRKKWFVELGRLYKRAQKGMHLFAEYFGNFWD